MKDMNKLPLNFRIDRELKEALEEEAAKDYRTITSLVVKILTKWKENREEMNRER